MDDSVCPICGEAVPTQLLKLHMKLEKTVIREMREENPEWFENGKLCPKFLEEFRLRHQRIKEEAREIRAKTAPYNPEITGKDGDIDTDDDI